MNTERIKSLADFLDALPDRKFNMRECLQTNHDCGTVACIAGWIVIRELGWDAALRVDIERAAAQMLGLNEDQREDLFAPSEETVGSDVYGCMPQDAAQALRHLAQTGEADWSILP